MCGRFTLTVSASVLAGIFEMDPPPGFTARFNIAPTQTHPVVSAGEEVTRQWRQCRWGLVPAWAKDPGIGARMINARAETATEKPSFRQAVRTRRCLVPADGFFEWSKTPGGKQPHHIRFTDRRVFAFGGLWERWDRGPEPPIESFTILTTTPNSLVRTIHDRMPVIIPPDSWDEWLEPAPLAPDRRDRLTAPYDPSAMESVQVCKRVNTPSNDDPECLSEIKTATV